MCVIRDDGTAVVCDSALVRLCAALEEHPDGAYYRTCRSSRRS